MGKIECSFEDLQDALIKECITPQQFFEVLIDNFGFKETAKILKKNLDLIEGGKVE